MCEINYCNTVFLKSIFNIKKEKYKYGFEIAFLGYSNSGKSTVINTLTNQTKLTRVSKTPGRTQLINIFEIFPGMRLVDFPGYGYSKTSKNIKLTFKNIIFRYLEIQKCLIGLVMLIDIRRPIKYWDKIILNLAKLHCIPILILLSKADKVNISKRNQKLNCVRSNKLVLSNNNISVELFSTLKNIGLNKLKSQVNFWINENVT
ncbi:MAG: ribosome biogenesis GTP-binding protein YihA/YsxC [Buchnera aphidicola (Nurudea shiraii)]